MLHSLRQPLKRLGHYLLIIYILSLPACEAQFTPDTPPIPDQTIETPSDTPSNGTTQPSLTTTIEGLLPDSHLTKETVQKVFVLAGIYLIHEGNNESIEFTCTITEGRFCWFTEEDLVGELYGTITKDLSNTIIGEIEAEVIDQAERNLLQVHCMRPSGFDDPITCEGNWGWTENWTSIEVR